MVEIKPCPFCGGYAYLDRHDIFCDDCHLVIRFDDFLYSGEAHDYEEAEKMAVETWNKRAKESDSE